jgi:hypothetical protein
LKILNARKPGIRSKQHGDDARTNTQQIPLRNKKCSRTAMIVSTCCAPQALGSEWTQFPQTDVFLVLQRACFLYEQTQAREHFPPELLEAAPKTCGLLRNMSRTECPLTMAAEIIRISV